MDPAKEETKADGGVDLVFTQDTTVEREQFTAGTVAGRLVEGKIEPAAGTGLTRGHIEARYADGRIVKAGAAKPAPQAAAGPATPKASTGKGKSKS